MKLIPKLYDPVEVAVRKLIENSHLNNALGFIPILKVRDIQEGDRLPIVTCETMDYRVKVDSVNDSTGYLITIWDYFPDRDNCTSLADLHEIAVRTVKTYAEDLIEITNELVKEELYPKADYTHLGERVILPRYKQEIFSSQVEAKNSPMKDRLMGASIQGVLSGHIDYICCTKGNFEIE